MNNIQRPSHYMHPTIPGLEARHVIENYPYHIATALAYLWRCGRKRGSKAQDDLQKAKQHIGFQMELIGKQGAALRPMHEDWRIKDITAEGFSFNIAHAMQTLLDATNSSDLLVAIDHIDFELFDLEIEGKLRRIAS